MIQLEEKAAEALACVQKAEKLMAELGYTKYSLSGMISAAMRHDLEKEVSKLLGELAEALEWKRYLSSWGGTPEIVYSFIQGQQARISAAQKVEKQRDALMSAMEQIGGGAHSWKTCVDQIAPRAIAEATGQTYDEVVKKLIGLEGGAK